MEFPCPGCGAELKWKPGGGELTCPFCGTAAQPDEEAEPTATIEEYRLDEALKKAPRGYGTATKSQTCRACGAVFDVEPSVTATECPFCTSTQVVAHDEDDALIRPESVLPFAVEKNDAVRQFRSWLGGLWFRPNALKKAAQLERIRGVYLPAWTFDAQASSRWTAQAGYHYYVDEQYTVEEDGKQFTRTRKVRKTRWEPASGSRTGSYDDWIVQASGGLDQAAIKGLLPFDLTQLKPYHTRFLSGFEAERYKVGLDAAWEIAQKELQQQEIHACRSLVPGDTQRDLKVATTWRDVHFKHTLLPVWVAAYRYDGKVYRYLVNGESGKASGEAPISKWKVFFFIVSLVVAIGGCLGLVSAISAIAAALGMQ